MTGGLCRTFWKDGFGFDIGGHILFSKHQHVNDLVNRLLGDNINHCRRANKILFQGPVRQVPVRERPGRAREAGLLRVLDRLLD